MGGYDATLFKDSEFTGFEEKLLEEFMNQLGVKSLDRFLKLEYGTFKYRYDYNTDNIELEPTDGEGDEEFGCIKMSKPNHCKVLNKRIFDALKMEDMNEFLELFYHSETRLELLIGEDEITVVMDW